MMKKPNPFAKGGMAPPFAKGGKAAKGGAAEPNPFAKGGKGGKMPMKKGAC